MHSVAAGLLQSKDKIHFFKDIGYQHDTFAHCPEGADWVNGKCSCNPRDNFGERSPYFIILCFSYLNPSCTAWSTTSIRLYLVVVPEQVVEDEYLKFTSSFVAAPAMATVFFWEEHVG